MVSDARELYEKLSDEFNRYGVRSTSWSVLEKLYEKADAYENKKQKADLLAKAIEKALDESSWPLVKHILLKALKEYNSEK